MKKLISVVMTIAVLLSASQPVWAIEETDEVDAVAASGMVKIQRLFAKTNLKVPVCRTYRTITQKCLQLELPTENSVYSQENRNRAENYAHLTSENGK